MTREIILVFSLCRFQLMVASPDVNDPAAMVALQAAQRAAEQAIQHVHQQQAQLEMAAAARATPQILVVTDPAQFAALQAGVTGVIS